MPRPRNECSCNVPIVVLLAVETHTTQQHNNTTESAMERWSRVDAGQAREVGRAHDTTRRRCVHVGEQRRNAGGDTKGGTTTKRTRWSPKRAATSWVSPQARAVRQR
jgi:hypothetical protein